MRPAASLAALFWIGATTFLGLVGGVQAAPEVPRTPDHVATPSPTPTPLPIFHPITMPRGASGPPANPTTPTLWLKPVVDPQVTLSNITESMSYQGKCAVFTITALLNAGDAVTVLKIYQKNEKVEANVYVPPSIVYKLNNATIKSYSESAGPSGSTATFTLAPQKFTVTTGNNSDTTDCLTGH